jgi:Spy/CpxP family protein refolding chaperone
MTELTSNSRRRVGLIAVAASVVAIAAGALAYAHSGGGHHGRMSSNPERHLEHLNAMLTKAGASEAQKKQIEGILRPAFGEMKAAKETHSAAFRQFHESILASSIDRARLETLRADEIKSLDEASKRVVTAITDAAEVLSPEQRAEFAKQIQEHHRR